MFLLLLRERIGPSLRDSHRDSLFAFSVALLWLVGSVVALGLVFAGRFFPQSGFLYGHASVEIGPSVLALPCNQPKVFQLS